MKILVLKGEKMSKKKFSALFLAILFTFATAISITTFQGSKVNAAVFQKINVPKRFRGTWYGFSFNNKVKKYRITKTYINLAHYGDDIKKGKKVRTYKYTKKAHDYQYKSYKNYISHQLIKINGNGNRIYMSYPLGENNVAYLSKNRKKLLVGVNTWVDTYYKSKAAAIKNHKKDKSKMFNRSLYELVWNR